ncbi:MAG: GntR family transcriptional regulator [Novosphingobium sp.]|jgi:DNA-binding GntR family transcriptional regulator|nr:GntR family transcriptional regulator [Novosphingobium sp.]
MPDNDENAVRNARGGRQGRKAGTGRKRQAAAGQVKGSAADRHLSPALRTFPADKLKIAPLTGTKASIYNSLWRPIADGRMKTGAKLGESELETIFGVSRTVVRSVLEHMATEGCIATPVNKTAHVLEPSPEDALIAFEVLGLTMVHIIRALCAPSYTFSPAQNKAIDLHFAAQTAADEADDRIGAHLLGVEFLILLAALYDAPLLTDLVSRTVVLETLSLKAYGEFPPPPWYVAFQRGLIDAILDHNPEEAVAEFEERLNHIRGTLRFDDTKNYEEADLGRLLTGKGA